MLKLKLNRHTNARLSNLLKAYALEILDTKKPLPLWRWDWQKRGGNFYEEQRTAKVPTTYRERYDWMSVFELLAHSMIITNIPLYVPSHYTRRNRHFFKVWEFRRRGCLRWRESRICSRKITEMAFEISWKYMRSALFFPFFA